jgi:hypothetical protein
MARRRERRRRQRVDVAVHEADVADSAPGDDPPRRLDGPDATVNAHDRPLGTDDLCQLKERPDRAAADVDDPRALSHAGSGAQLPHLVRVPPRHGDESGVLRLACL